MTFSFSCVFSLYYLMANTGRQTSSLDSRIKGPPGPRIQVQDLDPPGPRIQVQGLSLKGQTPGSRCQTQTQEQRPLQDPHSRLRVMKDHLKTPICTIQNWRSRAQDPEPRIKKSRFPQKGRSRSRIQDSRAFCRRERPDPTFQVRGSRTQALDLGFLPFWTLALWPPPPRMPLAGNSSSETQTKVSA